MKNLRKSKTFHLLARIIPENFFFFFGEVAHPCDDEQVVGEPIHVGLYVFLPSGLLEQAEDEAFGAAASPMSFGEVYTAIQSNVIDGAENNELALTNNKHGEVAKYYSYNMHQMVPDMLIGSLKFLNTLSDEEYEIFSEAARISTEVENVLNMIDIIQSKGDMPEKVEE